MEKDYSKWCECGRMEVCGFDCDFEESRMEINPRIRLNAALRRFAFELMRVTGFFKVVEMLGFALKQPWQRMRSRYKKSRTKNRKNGTTR